MKIKVFIYLWGWILEGYQRKLFRPRWAEERPSDDTQLKFISYCGSNEVDKVAAMITIQLPHLPSRHCVFDGLNLAQFDSSPKNRLYKQKSFSDVPF